MLVLTICIVVLSIAAVAFFVFIRRQPPPNTSASTHQPFSGVEIAVRPTSCDAAKDLVGQQLLAKDAPALPLDGCTQNCRCSWKKSADRRETNRRGIDDGLPEPVVFDATDNRLSDDRRS